MAVLELTVQPREDATHFDVTYTLDGARYRFSFYTNAVTSAWSFDVLNDDGSEGVRGLALTAGVDLLYPYRYLDLPQGSLFVRDKGLNGADPGLTDFWDGNAALYYLEAD
jgi:hypothetical protein